MLYSEGFIQPYNFQNSKASSLNRYTLAEYSGFLL